MEHHTKLILTHPYATPERREALHHLPATPLRTRALRSRRAAYALARTSWRRARLAWNRWSRRYRLNGRLPSLRRPRRAPVRLRYR